MKFLVTGSTGLIGSALLPHLKAKGHQVVTLVRDRRLEGPSSFYWDPAGGEIDLLAFDEVDGVVHLCGKNLFSGRWTRSLKRDFRLSRIESTEYISRAMAALDEAPRTLISASAVGYYGNTGTEASDESGPKGTGYLSDLCADWEAATGSAAARGVRVVNLRIGLVIEGLLKKLTPLFRLGLGGPTGNGRQLMSWIALPDLLQMIEFLLVNELISGPVNGVTDQPVTGREFARTLGKVLRRPAILPAPAWALRILLGREMAGETILKSVGAVPDRLLSSGFQFRYASLERAVRRAVE